MKDSSGKATDRRNFFSEAAARVVQPLAEMLEKKIPLQGSPTLLRPPGAVAEDTFLNTCQRCAACVVACPADAISLLPTTSDGIKGTPAINADLRACVVCDGLQCTHVCPSGALIPLDDPAQINMGLAEVYAPLCVRSDGEACTTCTDACPIGTSALRLNGKGPPEVLAKCVGCGVCQQVCPTDPKAIVVLPAQRN